MRDKFDNRRSLTNHQGIIPKAKQENGATKKKMPFI